MKQPVDTFKKHDDKDDTRPESGKSVHRFRDEDKSDFHIGTSAYYIYDVRKDRFIHMDEAIEKITGISAREFIDKTPSQTLGEVSEISHLEAINEFVTKSLAPRIKPEENHPITVNLIYNILARDNVHRRIHVKYVFMEFEGGLPLFTKGVTTDITHIQKDGLPVFFLVQNNKVIYKEMADTEKIISKSSIPLSRAEINVLRHTSMGISPKEIADIMNISVSTLYTHRKNIKAKMGKDINYAISLLREKGWL